MDLNKFKLDLLQDEGLRTTPYKDTTGNWTYGIGRNLSAKGLSLTEVVNLLSTARVNGDFVYTLLENDMREAVDDLYRNLPWVKELSEPRQRAIANMSFNLGINKLLKFSPTLALIKAGRFEEAAGRLRKTLWAKQVGARSERIIEQILNG